MKLISINICISSPFDLPFGRQWIIFEKISHDIFVVVYQKKLLSNIQGLGPPCRNFQICKNSLLLLKKNSSKIWFRARLLNFNIFREAISCEIRTRINLLNFTLVVKKWRVKSFFPSLSLSYTYKQPCHPFFKCFNCEILWFRAINYAFPNKKSGLFW